LHRRQLLTRSLIAGGVLSVAGVTSWYHFFDGPIFNACELDTFPDELRKHELMHQALDGLDLSQLWDCHFHLVGNGVSPAIDEQMSGAWLNPSMMSWMSPKQRVQYAFYLDAGCVKDSDFADREFIGNLLKTLATAPAGVKFMLLAFDYHHQNDGRPDLSHSTFHIPNEYAAKVANLHEGLEWIGSVHPYREDALTVLEWCANNGARAVKWLPPAMNIDPSSPLCDAFYEKLVALNLPLLTHAGEEQAVHSDELQKLANPLLLRKPLEMGVKVIVAHCASLGTSEDIESNNKKPVSNLELFARLMEEPRYENNLRADISAVNLFNRKIDEIKMILEHQEWHSRLLYASDFPLTGVTPIISSTNLASHGLLDKQTLPFLKQVRKHNTWLFDFLQKRFLHSGDKYFLDDVFHTQRHFV